MSNSPNPFSPPATVSALSPSFQGNAEAFAGTERGLRIVYAAILLIILSLILGMAVSIVVPEAAIVMGLAMIVGWLMWLVGPFFCLSVPTETGARGLIIASVSCHAASMAFAGLQFAVPFLLGFSSQGVVAIGGIFGQLLGLAGNILFILFMMKVGRQIGRDDLHRRGRNLLVLSAVLVVALMAMSAAMFTAVSGPSSLAGVMSGMFILFGLAALVAFIMYANLINGLYKAIHELRQQPRTAPPPSPASPAATFSEQPDETTGA